jgi:hypothetical protein
VLWTLWSRHTTGFNTDFGFFRWLKARNFQLCLNKTNLSYRWGFLSKWICKNCHHCCE